MLDGTAISDSDLLGFVDESLSPDRAALVEDALRGSADLRGRAAALMRDRDDGSHTLADIWRRHRVNCPSRSDLGLFLLGTLEDSPNAAISLHLDAVGCRYCQAELDDLRSARNDVDSQQRRQRFFESSVGRHAFSDS